MSGDSEFTYRERLANIERVAASLRRKSPKHEHLFTIPVEYLVVQDALNSGGHYMNTRAIRVTKLRCVCGEEIERGGDARA